MIYLQFVVCRRVLHLNYYIGTAYISHYLLKIAELLCNILPSLLLSLEDDFFGRLLLQLNAVPWLPLAAQVSCIIGESEVS